MIIDTTSDKANEIRKAKGSIAPIVIATRLQPLLLPNDHTATIVCFSSIAVAGSHNDSLVKISIHIDIAAIVNSAIKGRRPMPMFPAIVDKTVRFLASVNNIANIGNAAAVAQKAAVMNRIKKRVLRASHLSASQIVVCSVSRRKRRCHATPNIA